MKLTFILLFISFMQVSATLYSQNDRVSIQVKGGLIENGNLIMYLCTTTNK